MAFTLVAARFGKPGYAEVTCLAPWTHADRGACANLSSCFLLFPLLLSWIQKIGRGNPGLVVLLWRSSISCFSLPPSVIAGAGTARLPGCFHGVISFKQFPAAAHQFARCHLEMAARDSVWLRSPFCKDQGQSLTKKPTKETNGSKKQSLVARAGGLCHPSAETVVSCGLGN